MSGKKIAFIVIALVLVIYWLTASPVRTVFKKLDFFTQAKKFASQGSAIHPSLIEELDQCLRTSPALRLLFSSDIPQEHLLQSLERFGVSSRLVEDLLDRHTPRKVCLLVSEYLRTYIEGSATSFADFIAHYDFGEKLKPERIQKRPPLFTAPPSQLPTEPSLPSEESAQPQTPDREEGKPRRSTPGWEPLAPRPLPSEGEPGFSETPPPLPAEGEDVPESEGMEEPEEPGEVIEQPIEE